jgi:DNA-binding CsgD family transcriptional regulator/thioredoxin-like negative regulator of GroEL
VKNDVKWGVTNCARETQLPSGMPAIDPGDSPAARAHEEARAALVAGEWKKARRHLEASIAARETPEAVEDLGLTAWWLDDAPLTFEARERAYGLYRDRGDARGAARVAIWLVWDNLAFRGDFAVASGWLERARRILGDDQQSAEYGWLLIRQGEVALFRGHDPSAAIESAGAAAKLGRAIGDQSVEFTGLALEGLSRVSTGDIAGGMRCLDEATVAATSGDVKELHAVGLVCCWQIFACERVRDYDRAAQWCARVAEFSRRWGLHPLSSICRTQYAGVLIWRGDWEGAEKELSLAAREMKRARPASTGPAVARLGELRLRQGRFDDAERLFAQSQSQSQARLGLAALHLHRGEADESAEIAGHFLLQLGNDEATARVAALELLVRANAMRGKFSAAGNHLADLERIGATLGTDPVMASVAAARGTLARYRGDLAESARCLEAAVALFEKTGAPFETARARLDLAEVLVAQGRPESAAPFARAALDALTALGARGDIDRARRLIGTPGVDAKPRLTARQVEILRLVASGLSNGQIAAKLKLSEHTVKRHVANLLLRLDLPSRAAAAAYAAREGLL